MAGCCVLFCALLCSALCAGQGHAQPQRGAARTLLHRRILPGAAAGLSDDTQAGSGGLDRQRREIDLCAHSCPLSAALLCSVPDLYHSVFDLSVSDNAIVYLLITVASAAMITLAYRNVEQGTHTLSEHTCEHMQRH